jgi:hypothetical protein
MPLRVRPLSPDALIFDLARRVAALPAAGVAARVLVDGAPPAHPGRWADALVDPLRLLGRPVLRASAADFLRPASLRLEHGRQDPQSFLDSWLDLGALRRELLDPLGDGGSGRVLLRWWDADSDRSARAEYVTAPAGAVLVLDGGLMLGRGLPAELTVHLRLSDGALVRGIPADQDWTLPAYRSYQQRVRPEQAADVVLMVDHPRRPAIVEA